MIDMNGFYREASCFVDLNGKPVARDKYQYPYSYDPYVTFKGEYLENDSAVYSDRLMQWNFSKFEESCKKVFGDERQYFDNRIPKDVETFLSMYLNKNVKLTAIMQGCNVGNGYPYWIFFYRSR